MQLVIRLVSTVYVSGSSNYHSYSIQHDLQCNFGTPNLHRHTASIHSWNVQGSMCTVSDRYYFIIVILIIESEIVHDMDFVIHFRRRKQICKTNATVQLAIILCAIRSVFHHIMLPSKVFLVTMIVGHVLACKTHSIIQI